jgi:hypothetical protein
MGRHLFTIEDAFAVRERGTILVPGLPAGRDGRWQIGDALVLRRPDGSTVETTIRGMDLQHPGPRGEIAVLVPVAKADIPVGTEVWSE